jgi:hypothetical protein
MRGRGEALKRKGHCHSERSEESLIPFSPTLIWGIELLASLNMTRIGSRALTL